MYAYIFIYIYCFDLVFSATSTILSNTRTIDQSPPSCELKRSHCLPKVILQSDISRVGEGISNDGLERGVWSVRLNGIFRRRDNRWKRWIKKMAPNRETRYVHWGSWNRPRGRFLEDYLSIEDRLSGHAWSSMKIFVSVHYKVK